MSVRPPSLPSRDFAFHAGSRREKLEASQASAASVVNEVFWEPFFHSLLVREGLALPKHDDIAAVAARGPAAAEAAGASAGGLASLAVHKSKLELMREAAAARRQQAAGTSASEWSPVKRGPAAARGRLAAAAAASAEPGAAGGLSDLRVHKSALELAKEAATQAAEEARRPATARGRAEQAAAPGGLSDLKVRSWGDESPLAPWVLPCREPVSSSLRDNPTKGTMALQIHCRRCTRAAWSGRRRPLSPLPPRRRRQAQPGLLVKGSRWAGPPLLLRTTMGGARAWET